MADDKKDGNPEHGILSKGNSAKQAGENSARRNSERVSFKSYDSEMMDSGTNARKSMSRSSKRLSAIRAWKKSAVLFAVLLSYLTVGAIVFYFVERPHAIRAADGFDESLRHFAAQECVGDEGVETLMGILARAVGDGGLRVRLAKIAAETRGMTNETLIKERWTLDVSFLFTVTVVTTIGKTF